MSQSCGKCVHYKSPGPRGLELPVGEGYCECPLPIHIDADWIDNVVWKEYGEHCKTFVKKGK